MLATLSKAAAVVEFATVIELATVTKVTSSLVQLRYQTLVCVLDLI